MILADFKKHNDETIKELNENRKAKVISFLETDNNKELITNGQTPDGVEYSNIYYGVIYGKTLEDELKNADETTLTINDIPVATYNEKIGCWKLYDNTIGVNISPEELPMINGKPTISAQQYNYMYNYMVYQYWSTKLRNENVTDILDDLSVYEESIRRIKMIELQRAENKFYSMPKQAMDILSKMDKHPTDDEIKAYIAEKGLHKDKISNTETEIDVMSMSDMMACIFGENVGRIPELEQYFTDERETREVPNNDEECL